MAKQTRKVNTIKNGTIELVLLLLLQTNKKYGYQLAQEMSELSNGKYELKEATMYPTLYRLNQNGYLDFEQVKSWRSSDTCLLFYHGKWQIKIKKSFTRI